MKKIMFNDRFLLTQAVLEGRKTQTRRIITPQPYYDENVGMVWKGYMNGRGLSDFGEPQASYRNFVHNSKYKIGEIVAVAQSYKDIFTMHRNPLFEGFAKKHFEAGYYNKMFVKPVLMPYHIKITNVRVQGLQDITDEECLLEGVKKAIIGYYVNGIKVKDWQKESHRETEYGCMRLFPNPREAFAALIDKISGKGTWESNPYVFVYDFELVKYK